MRKTAFPELSTPQVLSLGTQKTTFSNASFRWTQATSESTRTTLDEEGEANKKLTSIAESEVNVAASIGLA